MELGEGRNFDKRGPHPYNIRQYMSYKIVDNGVLPRETLQARPCRPYSTYIFYILTASHQPANPAHMQPAHIRPDQLPDPWLLDSEALLKELARIRELTLRIPPSCNE